ncbi:hypothetical protein BGW42_002547 [Actinomortierella wolfii]|nr:hypothetical protein BGW42_002547 [Actinomortierella wolfii]
MNIINRPSRSRTRMPSTPITPTTPAARAAQANVQQSSIDPQPPQSPTTTAPPPLRSGRRSLSPIGGAANAMKRFLQRRRGATANGLVITGPFLSSNAPWSPSAEADDDNTNNLDLSHTSFGQLGSGFYAEKQQDGSSNASPESPISTSISSPCLSPVLATSPRTMTSFWSGMTSGRRGRQDRTVSVTMSSAPKTTTSKDGSSPIYSSPSSTPQPSASTTCTDNMKRMASSPSIQSPDPHRHRSTPKKKGPANHNKNNNNSSKNTNSHNRPFTDTTLDSTEAQVTTHQGTETPLLAPQPKTPRLFKSRQLANDFSVMQDAQSRMQGQSPDVSLQSSPSTPKDEMFTLPENIKGLGWVRPGRKRRAATANLASFSSTPSPSLASTATTPLPAPALPATPPMSKSNQLSSGTMSPPYSPSTSTSSLPLPKSSAMSASPSMTLSSIGQRSRRRRSESCLLNKARGSELSKDNTHIAATGVDKSREISVPTPSHATHDCRGGGSKRKEPYSNKAFTENKVLLISSHSSPTQFYDLPETRAKVRQFLTSVSGFEEVLEYGFPSDIAVEDKVEGESGLGCRYLTLRLTLTPWHARADEAELYGPSETQGKQQQFKTMVTKFFSRTSSSGPIANEGGAASTAAYTSIPTPSPSPVHSPQSKKGMTTPLLSTSCSGETLCSNETGLATLIESDHELCHRADDSSSQDDSMDSITDVPQPYQSFEKVEASVVRDKPTWMRSMSKGGGPKYPRSSPKSKVKPTVSTALSSPTSTPSTITAATFLPSKIPKLRKNRGFKMANSSPSTSATNVMIHSLTTTLMSNSTSTTATIASSVSIPSSTGESRAKDAATIAKSSASKQQASDLQPLHPLPLRNAPSPRFMALPESHQPPRKGSLTALSIPIAAASGVAGSSHGTSNGSSGISRSQSGGGDAQALEPLTAPSSSTVNSTCAYNPIQDGFHIRAHASSCAPSSPRHWPVYIPNVGALNTPFNSNILPANDGLIPVDGFASRNKRAGMDMHKSTLKPIYNTPTASSDLPLPLPSYSPLPSPRNVEMTIPQPSNAVPPPRPPRKRSGQLEKVPSSSVTATASPTGCFKAVTVESTLVSDDPPFEGVLLPAPFSPSALYTDSSSIVTSQPSTSTCYVGPSAKIAASTTTTRAQPVIQSDVFFETPAGLPNYQMDYIVSNSDPQPTLAPVKVSNYVFGPSYEPYQPRTRYIPNRRPTVPLATAATAIAPNTNDIMISTRAIRDENNQASALYTNENNDKEKPQTIPNDQSARELPGKDVEGDTNDSNSHDDDQTWEMVTLKAAPTSLQSSNIEAAESEKGFLAGHCFAAATEAEDDERDLICRPRRMATTAVNTAALEVAAVAAAAAAARRDDSNVIAAAEPLSVSSLFATADNKHGQQKQRHSSDRRGIKTATMILTGLRRPGQEQYVCGWSGGDGNGSLNTSLDPASYDEEDLIFGAYGYSYDDEADDNDYSYDRQEGDEGGDDDKEEEEEHVDGDADHQQHPQSSHGYTADQKKKIVATDARSETSEATTIYGQACIGIRMRAQQRSSRPVVTVRPHGQVAVDLVKANRASDGTSTAMAGTCW